MIHKIYKIYNWKNLYFDLSMLIIIIAITIYSIIIIWSASNQNIIMIKNRIIQFIIGFIAMIIIAQISPRMYEYWAFNLYIFCLILLILVNIFGHTINGAQRWLDFGFIRFQPSEMAKITVPLMIARFINRNILPLNLKNTILALIIILIPALLIAKQPDLGTSILVIISGFIILFLSGMSRKLITIIIISIICFIPITWFFLMHKYQQNRILILLNPEIDPFGAGYHIIQSKIAIGSGGLFGKGWLHGTQSHLNFLPECHTDFIFAVLAEELGLFGIIILLILYLLLIIRGIIIAINSHNIFNRVIASGLMLILFIYIFINISMVSGILPVVGVPLPLISYGGSSLIILMAEFGIIMSINTHKNFLSKNL